LLAEQSIAKVCGFNSGVAVMFRSISIFIVALFMPSLIHAETLTNDTIIMLSKAGLGEGLIIDKINGDACGYDVSTQKLIALKQVGLSDNVISAMVRRCATLAQVRGIAGDDGSADPKVRHSPGIYVLESDLALEKRLP
jgi:hypothetical protein